MKNNTRYCDEHDSPYENMSGGWRCRACEYARQTEYRKRTGFKVDPKRQRAYYDKHKYGLSYEESTALRKRGRCDGCGAVEGKMCIDHCHETGTVRGLLCQPCNLILGHAKDNPQLLRILADYLERNQ